MSGPARAGLFLYAIDFVRVASFYEAMLGLARIHSDESITVLEGDGVQLVVHAIPPDIAATIVMSSPPVRRSNVALKVFFTIPSIERARLLAPSLGGALDSEEWEGRGFRVCNAVDPEGNVFQVRERLD